MKISMKKLLVCGKNGRMAAQIRQLAGESKTWKIVENWDSAEVGIDFTAPEGTARYLALAAEKKKPIVIGTTGLSENQMTQLQKTAKKIPIVYSPNMAIGMNVLFSVVRETAEKLGGNFEIAIAEKHHLHKKDRPSGTAKMLGTIIQSVTGKKTPIDSLREAEEIGEHSVVFASLDEHLVFYHRALDRKVFASGSLRAAEWLVGKNAGLYSMANVLGLS